MGFEIEAAGGTYNTHSRARINGKVYDVFRTIRRRLYTAT